MIFTKKEAAEQNPYEAFVILLAELEAAGFFAQASSAIFGNDRYQPLLQCYFID
jgi:hypothetical protein